MLGAHVAIILECLCEALRKVTRAEKWIGLGQVRSEVAGMGSKRRRAALASGLAAAILAVLSLVVSAHAPTSVQASDGTHLTYVKITWHASSDAVRYRILRTRSVWQAYTSIADVVGSETSFNDHDVQSCVVYHYMVAGYNTTDGFAYSNSDTGFAGAAPSAPGPVSASLAYADKIVVSWPATPKAAEHHVLRADSQSGTYALVAATTDLNYVDTVPSCSDYWYKVQTCNGCGCGPESVAVLGETTGEGAPPPSVFVQTSSDVVGEARVAWDASPNASYYQIERQTPPVYAWEIVGTTTDTSFTIPPPPSWNCGHLDKLQLRGCNCRGQCGGGVLLELDWSEKYVCAPSDLTATPITSSSLQPAIRLDWTPVAGADDYEVWVLPQSPDVASLNPAGVVQSPPFIDLASYECMTGYWVRACHGLYPACRICGPLASIAAEKGPVMAPVWNAQATQGTSTYAVAVSWDPCAGATHYEVLRTTLGSQTESQVAWVAGYATTYWVDQDLQLCQTYSYRVRGCNACGCGPESEFATGYSSGGPGDVLASVQAVPDGVPVTLVWNEVPRATYYLITRQGLGPNQEIKEVATVNELYYEDVPPVPCVDYIYNIWACNACGRNSSHQLYGRYAEISPKAPTWVTAGMTLLPSGFYTLLVAWEPVPYAKNYDVRVEGPDGTEAHPYQTKTSLSLSSDFGKGTVLLVSVSSRNECGYSSPYSDPIAITVP